MADCNENETISGAEFNVSRQQVAASSYMISACPSLSTYWVFAPGFDLLTQVTLNEPQLLNMTCKRKYSQTLFTKNSLFRTETLVKIVNM